MEIAEIKQQLSILQVLNHYGLSVKKDHVNCPFHDDKTPSMRVYEKTNTVYCFSGNCKTHEHSLDAIDFIMHKEDLGKRESILKAKGMLGELSLSVSKELKASVSKELKPIPSILAQLEKTFMCIY